MSFRTTATIIAVIAGAFILSINVSLFWFFSILSTMVLNRVTVLSSRFSVSFRLVSTSFSSFMSSFICSCCVSRRVIRGSWVQGWLCCFIEYH
ncbi:MAG: hypothetical protein ISP01_05305 [Methanobrevibacter arboriphilus]|uniref:Uncharacterized protein n=1 Tax=Methanobrevibacter arboriphilus TaxID=39441 RepID=A0A843AIB6_METAZ|nr:hypothetical protein [Methanobrevibacter arboriphilus]MBF4468805.1 hypothetical protein [Methanobrevibacter arboriphilus]